MVLRTKALLLPAYACGMNPVSLAAAISVGPLAVTLSTGSIELGYTMLETIVSPRLSSLAATFLGGTIVPERSATICPLRFNCERGDSATALINAASLT
jgi:hypothetical protein